MSARWVTAVAVATISLTTSLAMAACASGGPGSAGSGDEWPTGRTFLSTAVTDSGADRPLVEGTRLELRFQDDGTLGANAGCNHMGGAAEWTNGTLVVRDLAMTEMGCPDGRNEQDSWFIQVLTGSPKVDLSGNDLTLTQGALTIRFTDREVVDPDRPLAGTDWVVDTILDGDAASSVPPSPPATLRINDAGTFEATTGCAGGTLTGSAGARSGRISFIDVKATECATESNALDAAVRAVLRGEVSYEIKADRLVLTGADGHGLGLVAKG